MTLQSFHHTFLAASRSLALSSKGPSAATTLDHLLDPQQLNRDASIAPSLSLSLSLVASTLAIDRRFCLEPLPPPHQNWSQSTQQRKKQKKRGGATIQQNRAIMECVRAGRVEAGARRGITGCPPHGRRTERRRSSVPWPRGVGRGRAASEPPSTAPRASLDKTERTEASRTASGSSGLDYSRLLECCEPDAAPLNVAVLVSGGVDSSVALQVRTDPDLFSFHCSEDVFIYIYRERESERVCVRGRGFDSSPAHVFVFVYAHGTCCVLLRGAPPDPDNVSLSFCLFNFHNHLSRSS